jgi:RimJ/RimL family protein N-acetyltransferase
MSVLIRPLERHDFQTIIGWFPSEAALIQWGGPDVRFPLGDTQLAAMAEEGRRTPPSRRLWVGELDGVVAAHALAALDGRHGVARLARVCISPALRGRGLSVPFLYQIILTIFADPIFERIELNVYTFNDTAIRTYRKLGFIQEGVRRSAVKVGNERWDSAIFGLLRAEHAQAMPGS